MSAPRPRRRAAVLLAALAVAVGGPFPLRAARADRPTAEMRARVEDAFVDGRLDALEALAEPGEEPVSVEPVAVRDLYWRPVTGARAWKDPRPDLDPTGVSARRIAWLRAHAAARARGEPFVAEPYPAPAPGEDDPYPRLAAWVRDRQLREGAGTDAIEEDGPLAALTDDELSTYFVRSFRRPAIAGPGTAVDEDEATRAKRLAVHEGVARARELGLVAVGLWGLVGVALFLRRGRRVQPAPAPTDA